MDERKEIGTVPAAEEARLSALAARLPEGRKGLLRWPEETGSTNTALRALAEAGAPAGTAVLAERQRAGRGRMGRSFASPPGGLYLSYLLRPAGSAAEPGAITARAAVAVRRAVAAVCGLSPEIKWVNDLLLEGRKLCGILAEAVLRGGRAESVVLGIGINAETRREDFPPELRDTAASLGEFLPAPPDRLALAAALLKALDEMAGDDPARRGAYYEEYRGACVTLGKQVYLSDGTEGFAEGLGEDFSLLLRREDGSLRVLRSGEASLHRAP